jgi:hypothetical protein
VPLSRIDDHVQRLTDFDPNRRLHFAFPHTPSTPSLDTYVAFAQCRAWLFVPRFKLLVLSSFFRRKKQANMTSTHQERWQRVKNRLRIELGDDVFSSWFARMEIEAVDNGAVRLSVPTRFLRNWIQSHYSERVLSNWQAEEPTITHL